MNNSLFRILWSKHKFDSVGFRVICILFLSIFVTSLIWFTFNSDSVSETVITHSSRYKSETVYYNNNNKIDLSKEDDESFVDKRK